MLIRNKSVGSKKKGGKRKSKKPEIIPEETDSYPDFTYTIDSVDTAEEIAPKINDGLKKPETPKSITLSIDSKVLIFSI